MANGPVCMIGKGSSPDLVCLIDGDGDGRFEPENNDADSYYVTTAAGDGHQVTPSDERVEAALQRLGATRLSGSMDHLGKLIDYANTEIRDEASCANARTLIDKIRTQSDPKVRQEIAFRLHDYKECHEAMIELMETLEADADENTRGKAAASLGFIGNRLAIPALLAATGDKSPVVRERAASALGALKAAEAVPQLVKMLDDESKGVQIGVANALGDIGDRSALPALQKKYDRTMTAADSVQDRYIQEIHYRVGYAIEKLSRFHG